MSTSENNQRQSIDGMINDFKTKGILYPNFSYLDNKLEILSSWTSFCKDFEEKFDKVLKSLQNENVDFQEVATAIEEMKEMAARLGAKQVVEACVELQELSIARNIVGCNEAYKVSLNYCYFRGCFDMVLKKEIATAPLSEDLNRFSVGRLRFYSRINRFIDGLKIQGILYHDFNYSDNKHVFSSSFFDDVKAKLKKVDKSLEKKQVDFLVVATTVEEIKRNVARIGGKVVVEACVKLQEFISARDIIGCKEAYEKMVREYNSLCASFFEMQCQSAEDGVGRSNIADVMFATPLARPCSLMWNNQSSKTKRKRSEQKTNMEEILERVVEPQHTEVEQMLALHSENVNSVERKQIEVMRRVEELVGFTENEKRLICEKVCHDTFRLSYFTNMKLEWVQQYCMDMVIAIVARDP